MNDTSLYFEIISISLLLGLGIALLLSNLPGWGLISIAGVLSLLTIGLRRTSNTSRDLSNPV